MNIFVIKNENDHKKNYHHASFNLLNDQKGGLLRLFIVSMEYSLQTFIRNLWKMNVFNFD